MPDDEYKPLLSNEAVDGLHVWHERAYAELKALGATSVRAYGLQLETPEGVFPPAESSDYSNVILADVRPDDRVLDMGTGSGIQALLAATVSADVLGVDVNPLAVAAAEANATRNGLDSRARFLVSDLFASADGRFDLIVFDPPFRWFRPRDPLEAAICDENYRTLTSFVREVREHLRPRGRVLLNFGTSADIAYLYRLLDDEEFQWSVAAESHATQGEQAATYYVLRVTDSPRR